MQAAELAVNVSTTVMCVLTQQPVKLALPIITMMELSALSVRINVQLAPKMEDALPVYYLTIL